MTKKKKIQRIGRAELTRKLDTVVSQLIRLRDCGGRQYYGRCITCSDPVQMTTCEAGHFIRRGNYSVRWNLDNIHAQCVPCNHSPDKAAMEEKYRCILFKLIGEERFAKLIECSMRPVPTLEEMKIMLFEFKKIVRELED
jgi:hypothetical protein